MSPTDYDPAFAEARHLIHHADADKVSANSVLFNKCMYNGKYSFVVESDNIIILPIEDGILLCRFCPPFAHKYVLICSFRSAYSNPPLTHTRYRMENCHVPRL